MLMSRACPIGNSVASAFIDSAVKASSGPTSSSTQMPRPCVPTTSALSRSWKIASSTDTVGMFVVSAFHVEPPSFEKCTPRSCARTSSRLCGMLADAIDGCLGQSVRQRAPRRARVLAHEDVRLVVVGVVAVEVT